MKTDRLSPRARARQATNVELSSEEHPRTYRIEVRHLTTEEAHALLDYLEVHR